MEGASEGALIVGSVDGSPEGEGEVQNGRGNGICECRKSKDFNDGIWKYLLDFVLVGILMFAMSGMKRKNNPPTGQTSLTYLTRLTLVRPAPLCHRSHPYKWSPLW